jgi:capsular polysaccharide transport system permease protein
MTDDPTAAERARTMTRKVLDKGDAEKVPASEEQAAEDGPMSLTSDYAAKPADPEIEAETVETPVPEAKATPRSADGPKKRAAAAKGQDVGRIATDGDASPPAKGKAKAKKDRPAKPKPAQVAVHAPAQTAALRDRHHGLLLSFVLLVVLPLGALAFYLWNFAEDQYGSTTGFSVRSEEGGSASDLFSGLNVLSGGATNTDSDILYEYIQSQEIVKQINNELDLRGHYSQFWPQDWLFSAWPDISLEWLVWYWQRIVRISYDQPTGLMEVRVLAFDPEYAQTLAQAIVSRSQERINALSDQARSDAMRYALLDVEEALEELKRAREALTQFRTRTRIVDPEADIQGRMGVMNNLQQSLASALIEFDLLRDTATSTDPRVTNAQRRIEVIRERIAAERQTFASDSTELGAVGEDYPSLIAEFESLSVDREFAEETYRAALTALNVARDNAARQSRYLATYIQPTRAETSEFPRRMMLTALAALFLLMFWAILALIFYSIRDRG